MNYKRGVQLSPQQREQVLSTCVSRYTADHVPGWVYDFAQKYGQLYPMQFLNDMDWLVNTRFPIDDLTGRVPLNFADGDQKPSPTYPYGNRVTRLD